MRLLFLLLFILLLLRKQCFLCTLVISLLVVNRHSIISMTCCVVYFATEYLIARLTDPNAKSEARSCQESFTSRSGSIRRCKTSINREFPISYGRIVNVVIVE